MVNYLNKMIRVFGILVTMVTVACGSASVGVGGKDGKGGLDADGNPIISQEAREDFAGAVKKYKIALKEGWNEVNCKSMISEFEDVLDEHPSMFEALFNVGVIQRSCGDKAAAKKTFETITSKGKDHQSTLQLSLVHLAVMDLEEGNESSAQTKLKKAVAAGRNTMEAVPAYTLVATILRNHAKKGDAEAWKKSQRALRTALAIDSKHIPALYQLMMLYFDIALELKRPSYLTLASLVFDQARKTDPEYAPIYHALARIQLNDNKLVDAINSFEKAFQKDPTLYEAYMSFGAINLNFRGYEQAKTAFEKAISLKPKNYDAHMGRGVAARGIGDYEMAKAEYRKAAEIDPARTDYIFNLGLLEMDYTNDGTPAGYEKAAGIFEKFLKKATAAHKKDPDGSKGKQKSWVKKAEDRIAACHKASKQIREAEKEMAELQKLAAEQAKLAKEAEAMKKKADELAKQEAEGGAAGEKVDEAAIEAELAAEEAKAKEASKAEKEAAKAKKEAVKAEKEAEKEAKKAKKEAAKSIKVN